MSKPVILTGLRANNDLTLGNYLGALLPMIDMAKAKAGDYQINLFVPDLHSFTTPINHAQLQNQIMQNLKIFAAAGLPLEHPDVYIYRQSYIPAHSELTWILDCFTGMGEMNRMTQFKDKAAQYAIVSGAVKELNEVKNKLGISELKNIQMPGGGTILINGNDVDQEIGQRLLEVLNKIFAADSSGNTTEPSVGLFNYPILMAADILLYNASYIPVGDDQTQHIEYTRDIALRMNNKFSEAGVLFTVPLPVPQQHAFFGKDQGLRIKDLQNPTKKMSKSDETGKGVIFMSDSRETASKKIKSATTDTFGEIRFDKRERPGISNLMQIEALLTQRELGDVVSEWSGKTSYGDLKSTVADTVGNFLETFQSNLADVSEEQILRKLGSSEAAMNEIANETLLRAQKAVGLRA